MSQNPVTDKHVGTPPIYDYASHGRYREIRSQAGLPLGFEPTRHRKKSRRKDKEKLTFEDFVVGDKFVGVIKETGGFTCHFYCEVMDSSDWGVYVYVLRVEHEKYNHLVGHVSRVAMEWFNQGRGYYYWLHDARNLWPSKRNKADFNW